MTDTIEIKKGLAGVTVDYTAVSKVNPDSNSLLYRGYPVQELAATQPVEAVAYLLWHGELPTADELEAFRGRERAHRALDENITKTIDLLPLEAHPMDVVRTAVSVIGASDPEAYDASPESDLRKAERLFAKLPAIVAYDQRRRRGQQAIEPRDDLDYSHNFLWMTFGVEPDPTVADGVQRVDDHVRRALVQRVDLHRARHHEHDGRPLLRRRRRDRRAQGRPARRGERGRHAHLRRDRLG